MQLLVRTTVLALCVLGVLALPHLSNQLAYEPSLEAMQVQLLAARIDTRAMTPAEAKCANTYNIQIQNINNTMMAQTNWCFKNAKQTTIKNKRTIDVTVTAIRRDITLVQTKLDACGKLQDNTAYLNCITESYDINMQLLDSSNSQAYQVMAQNAPGQAQSEIVRQGCTNSAIGHSKREIMQCTTRYTVCLNAIRQY